MSGLPEYEVHAIRYGSHDDRRVFENFVVPLPVGFDVHDAPMPMNFYAWVLRSRERVIAVDTGYEAAEAANRGRKIVLPVVDGLKKLGISREAVKDVILTHLHWDHAGNLGLYPNARFHVQAREMQFCTGPCMCHATMRRPYSVEDVTALVRHVFAGHVQFHEGTTEIAPGVHVHLVGGHSRGLQIVTVNTRRGLVVLASDASHFYANLECDHLFPIIDSAEEMLEGFQFIRRLAPTSAHIVPGHDPEVMRRYPSSLSGHMSGIVRLDADPVTII